MRYASSGTLTEKILESNIIKQDWFAIKPELKQDGQNRLKRMYF